MGTGEGLLEPCTFSHFTCPVRFTELKIKGFLDRTGLWRSLREMRRMFNFHKTSAAGEALGHDPDLFLGHQFPSPPGDS